MRTLDALELFSRQLVADGRSAHTLHQYRRHVRLFDRWATAAAIGDEVEQVRPDDVARFLAHNAALMRPDGRRKRPQSVNALRSSLKGFFRYTHGAGFCGANPTALLRRARCGGAPPRALTREESARLLAAFNAATTAAAKRDQMLVRLLLATGLRLGSALGLDVEDINLAAGEITVHDCKGAREERVVLGRCVREVLSGFLKLRTTGPLFTNQAGERLPVRQAQRRLGRWFAAAELRASAHSLRHTFATRLYEATHDPLLVKQALHHRSMGSTMTYVRATNDQVREGIELLSVISHSQRPFPETPCY